MVKNQDKLLHIHVYPGVDKQEVPANRHQSVSYNKNMKLTASANGFTVADVKIMSSVQCAVRGINEELTFFFFFKLLELLWFSFSKVGLPSLITPFCTS